MERDRGLEALEQHVSQGSNTDRLLVVDMRVGAGTMMTSAGSALTAAAPMPPMIAGESVVLSQQVLTEPGHGPAARPKQATAGTDESCTLFLVRPRQEREMDDEGELAACQAPELPRAAMKELHAAFSSGHAAAGVSVGTLCRAESAYVHGDGPVGAIGVALAAGPDELAEMAAAAGTGAAGGAVSASSSAANTPRSGASTPSHVASSASTASFAAATAPAWCWRDEVKRARMLAARTKHGIGASSRGRAGGGLVAPVSRSTGSGGVSAAPPPVAASACDAAARVWLRLIGDYDAFLITEEEDHGQDHDGRTRDGAGGAAAAGGPASPKHAASSMAAVEYDTARALSVSSSEARPFLEQFFQTQCFAGFLDRQTRPNAGEDPHAALVDALLDQSKGAKPRLLADAHELGHCTTTVVLPPQAATVETAERLRSATEEGSVARLAVHQVTLEDVLRCDAIETVLDEYQGRRDMYPDTGAEEAAALRSRVDADEDACDSASVGDSSRGRAMSGESTGTRSHAAAARRRRSRAVSRKSLGGIGLDGVGSSSISPAGGGSMAPLGWFARLFGAAGKAEQHRRSSGIGLAAHGPRASLLGDLVLESAAGSDAGGSLLSKNGGGEGGVRGLKAARAAEGKATWSAAAGHASKAGGGASNGPSGGLLPAAMSKHAARRQRLDMHRARRAAAEILARTDSPVQQAFSTGPSASSSSSSHVGAREQGYSSGSSAENGMNAGSSGTPLRRLVSDAKVLQGIASPLRSRPGASRLRLFSPARQQQEASSVGVAAGSAAEAAVQSAMTDDGESGTLPGSPPSAALVTAEQLRAPNGWQAADRGLLRATLLILERGRQSDESGPGPVFRDALKCAMLKCSAADVQAVWSEVQERAGNPPASLEAPSYLAWSKTEAAYLAGLVTCNHLSQVALHLARRTKSQQQTAYVEALPLEAVGPTGTVQLSVSLPQELEDHSDSGRSHPFPQWTSVSISAAASSRCPNPTCGLQGSLVQQIRSTDGIRDETTIGSGGGAGLQHRCPSCGTGFSPRIQAEWTTCGRDDKSSADETVPAGAAASSYASSSSPFEDG